MENEALDREKIEEELAHTYHGYTDRVTTCKKIVDATKGFEDLLEKCGQELGRPTGERDI